MLYMLFLYNIFIAPVENNPFGLARNAVCSFSPQPPNPFIPPIRLIPESLLRSPSYLNVPTGLFASFGSTTQTATLDGTT